MAFVINISSFKHDFLRQSYFLNQFEHLISYWSGFSWRSLEVSRMLPCSDFLASSPAPRLYWQWMFARRCCPRRACYTLRKSRRFITWQIYCLPCLSLPSRNLSEWGNSTSRGSRPLFFLKMKKKGGNIWYFWWHCWCLLPTKYRCKPFCATKPLFWLLHIRSY